MSDLHLRIQRTLSISGRISPPPQQKGMPLDFHRVGPRLSLNVFADQAGSCDADGSFTIGVLPGTYVLSASDRQTGKTSRPVTIEVRDKSVANVELTLASVYEISGRIGVDGSERLDFSKLMLNFLGEPVKIDRSGTFHATLIDGKARYMLEGLPEDWYIKDVLVSGRHVAGRQFEVEAGNSDVSFILSPRGGRVEIKLESVANGRQKFIVALLPENGPQPDMESTLHGAPDPSGKFVVHAVPPGSYRVFSLDASNWALVMRPDLLMEKYGKSAPLVKVAEGERKSIVVPLAKLQPE